MSRVIAGTIVVSVALIMMAHSEAAAQDDPGGLTEQLAPAVKDLLEGQSPGAADRWFEDLLTETLADMDAEREAKIKAGVPFLERQTLRLPGFQDRHGYIWHPGDVFAMSAWLLIPAIAFRR